MVWDKFKLSKYNLPACRQAGRNSKKFEALEIRN